MPLAIDSAPTQVRTQPSVTLTRKAVDRNKQGVSPEALGPVQAWARAGGGTTAIIQTTNGASKGISNPPPPPPGSSRTRQGQRDELLEGPRPYHRSLRHFSPHAHSLPPRPSVTGEARTRFRAHPRLAFIAPFSLKPVGCKEAEKRQPFFSSGRDRPQSETAAAAPVLFPYRDSQPHSCCRLLLLPPTFFFFFFSAAAAPHPSAPRSAGAVAAAAQNDAISQQHRQLLHNTPPAAAAPAPSAPKHDDSQPRRSNQPPVRASATANRNLWNCRCFPRPRRRPGGRAPSAPSRAQRQWEGRTEPEPRLFKGDRAYS
ncbi:uncharacterized protein LOC135181399 [Pogoniulus pusillus]|uniref:uncharacterized protein LOC135181399 n=1 Tax=Pogoniulus pusillus TaxID=488313 RepID=UPI0030B96897